MISRLGPGISLGLLTDMYQLTMAYGYWKLGRHDLKATFQLYFRHSPFDGGFTISAGLADALDYLENLRFDDNDLAYLASLVGNDDRAIFEPAFLEYLSTMTFSCDVDAIPEGTVVFPNEPLVRVTGPIMQCQIVETPLLNIINFQSLIATKAARVCLATQGEPVLEFGLRRAHGIDGGLSASRAAYIGGCAATSNLLAGKVFGIPVKGTHAHSWVMSFDSEIEAFRAYVEALPNNCVLLVDTYDTLNGIEQAIEMGREMRIRGRELTGIRLDSGDLAYLSIKARQMLDAAGFEATSIVASNDLDETIIASLKQQGCKISIWGVGTRLVTAFDQPALGGVYKLSALQDASGTWHPKLKLSEQAIKISHPGRLKVRRYFDGDQAVADMIYDEMLGDPDSTIVDPLDATRRRTVDHDLVSKELMTPVIRNGRPVSQAENLTVLRQRTIKQLSQFHDGIKRRINPHVYPVGLDKKLFDSKMQLILEARGFDSKV